MDAKVTIYDNFEAEVSTWKELVDELEKIAQNVAEVARATAPHDSGEYAASIAVERFKSGARVVAKTPYAGQIEFGSKNTSRTGQWILYRAAQSLGLKFRKKR